MQRVAVACVAGLGVLLGVGSVAAQPPSITIPRVAEPPSIERYISGQSTPPGIKVTGFQQREPGDGTPATLPTDVYLSYDQKHFYAVFICRDDPAKVRANLTKREAIMGDDLVGLVLDTYHDGRRAYMFLINPLGIQMDGVTTEGQSDDYSYDTVWASDGRVTPDGFVVVVSIPFKSLRFSSAPAQTWGVAVARLVPRFNETSFWPYITRRISGFGKQMATMNGIAGISPGRNLLAIPYGNFAADRVLGEDGYERDQSARVGIDAKAVIKDAVTVDLTVNPDFSQVESDEPQVTINQRYEVFFPEKRPFFIENAGYFETPETLFFSRRVADPLFGARITGKAAGWAFAALVVNDDAPGERVSAWDDRHGKSAGIGVIRVQREFARQSHIGGIFTDREWGTSANRVFGVDGRWRIDDNWTATAQWIGSRTEDPLGDTTTGSAFTARISRSGRGFDYSSSYLQRSPDFRSDVGFIRRVDMKEMEHDVGYSWHPKDSRVLRFGPDLEVGAVWDYAGTLQDWTIEPGFEVEFPGQTEIGVRHWNMFERFQGIEFRRHSTMLRASSEWLSWLNLDADVEFGTEVNYYPAGGAAPFRADARSAELGVTFKPLPRLRVDESYLYARLSTRDGEATPSQATGTIFTNHILRTRANYQFTRALSLRAIVDYEAVLPNERLVALEREKRFGYDVLATYLVNPWTAVYIGYTDTYENWILGSATERPIGRSGSATTSVGRQVFVKISYLLRY